VRGRRYWIFRHGLYEESLIRNGICTGFSHECPAFAEMIAASNYSFLRGASHPADMVVRAVRLGMVGMGIADRNSVAGARHKAWKELGREESGLKLVVGARLVSDDTPDIVAYPTTRHGWGADGLLTLGNRRAERAIASCACLICSIMPMICC
jgi:DNA polymerase III alpha subunit